MSLVSSLAACCMAVWLLVLKKLRGAILPRAPNRVVRSEVPWLRNLKINARSLPSYDIICCVRWLRGNRLPPRCLDRSLRCGSYVLPPFACRLLYRLTLPPSICRYTADFTALYALRGSDCIAPFASLAIVRRAASNTLRISPWTFFSIWGLLISSDSSSRRCFTNPSTSILSFIYLPPTNLAKVYLKIMIYYGNSFLYIW